MGVKVKVIKTELVKPQQPCQDHLLPLTNLDLVVPPIDVGSISYYTKSHEPLDATTMFDTLKTSLSQALAVFYPLAGEIAHNASGEPEIHCNNKGVDFTLAFADVELRELNFYNPDEGVGGELMPKRHRGLLAIQVTMLKCGGMTMACLYDHRVVDGYSTYMFASYWANFTRSHPSSFLPHFHRSILSPRPQRFYTPSVANMFVPISELPSLPSESNMNQDSLINRLYYIESDQITRIQLLVNKDGNRMSKVESFTSFVWKITASFLEDSGDYGNMCNVLIAVDGRRMLSEGEGAEKQKLMATYCGNVVSYPFRGIPSKDLKDMPLSLVADNVHKLFESASTKEHFKELIDWVEEQKPEPFVSSPFSGKEKAVSFMVSSGVRFSAMDNMNFGLAKPVFLSIHIPEDRTDCQVMLLASPIKENDWIAYMHLPKKQLDYLEARVRDVFKPLTADYLKLVSNTLVARI